MDTRALNTILNDLIGQQRRYEIQHGNGKRDAALDIEFEKIKKLIIDSHECYLKERKA